MITKAEAVTLAALYSKRERERFESWLRIQALNGIVGGMFTYSALTSNADLTAAKLEAEAGGWLVTVDAPNKTATLS